MHIRRILAKQLIICSLFFLGSCGSGKPDIDEDKFLEAIGFNKPISVSVRLNQLFDSQGQLQNIDNTPLIALLAHAGFIRVLPNANAIPWWNFNVSGGTLENEQFTLPVGKRVVTGHTDEKSWSEGAIKYFAETVTYSIQLNDPIKSISNPQPGNFSLRLVLMNDPAVGQWQVLESPGRGTLFDPNDAAGIVQQLAAQGSQYQNDLTQLIDAAKQQAYSQIEQILRSNGVVERDPHNPDVLISRRNGLAYYVRFNSQPTTTLGALDQYCQSAVVTGYGSEPGKWHLASFSEMGLIVGIAPDTMNGLSTGKFPDTPDRRLWYAIARPVTNSNLAVDFVTSTLIVSGGARYPTTNLPNTMYNPTITLYALHNDGSVAANGLGFSGTFSSLSQFGLNPVADSAADFRALCVTELNGGAH